MCVVVWVLGEVDVVFDVFCVGCGIDFVVGV